MFDFSNNLDLTGQDLFENKKRGRQQRGADGKFESYIKDQMGSDFNGPTFSISNTKQGTADLRGGLMGNKASLKQNRQEHFIRRDKLHNRTRQGVYGNGLQSSQMSQINKKRSGGNRGPVAAEFFGQGNLGGDSLEGGDGLKTSQEYFGSSYELKGGLDSQESGLNHEEMFSSPIKLGQDISMAGED